MPHSAVLEISGRSRAVMLYLPLQLFNGSKLSLVAQAAQETHADNVAVKIARPVHDVSFNGWLRSFVFKGRARADVRDAATPDAFNQCGRHVNAAARDDAVLRPEIGGREPEHAPALSPMHDA